MDEHYEYFLGKMGPPIARREASPENVDRWRGVLPDQLLAYWQQYGWAGYAQGLLWLVNPDEYGPVVEAWLDDTPYGRKDSYHMIALGAFGELYFWGERTGDSLTVVAADAVALPSRGAVPDVNLSVRAWFGSQNTGSNDFSDSDGKPLFARALKKLGRLNPGEMYGFVPALALGGPARLENLQKVKAVEHLVMLAQLSELRESRLLL